MGSFLVTIPPRIDQLHKGDMSLVSGRDRPFGGVVTSKRLNGGGVVLKLTRIRVGFLSVGVFFFLFIVLFFVFPDCFLLAQW